MYRTHPQIPLKYTQNNPTVCSVNGKRYRYGFNQGSVMDDQISGTGNHYTTLYRELDTRLGRWWSIDPEIDILPWQSPYTSMDNIPIRLNDPDGDIPIPLGYYLLAIAMGPDILGAPTTRPGELQMIRELKNERDNTLVRNMMPPLLRTTTLLGPGNYRNLKNNQTKVTEKNTSSQQKPKDQSNANKVNQKTASEQNKKQETTNNTNVAKPQGKFLDKGELAKRLGTTVKDYHDNIKPKMKLAFKAEMKKIGTTNPDFSPDNNGNVMLKNPMTGKVIGTNVPFDKFKKL